MALNILIRIGQAILAILVVSLVLYRVALALDMVPEGFSPSGIMREEYTSFKVGLQSSATSDDLQGKISAIILRNLDRIEHRFHAADTAKNATPAEKATAQSQADKCSESALQKFFMGTDSNNPCGSSEDAAQKNLQKIDEMTKIPPPSK